MGDTRNIREAMKLVDENKQLDLELKKMNSMGADYVKHKPVQFQRRGNSGMQDGRGTVGTRFSNFE